MSTKNSQRRSKAAPEAVAVEEVAKPSPGAPGAPVAAAAPSPVTESKAARGTKRKTPEAAEAPKEGKSSAPVAKSAAAAAGSKDELKETKEPKGEKKPKNSSKKPKVETTTPDDAISSSAKPKSKKKKADKAEKSDAAPASATATAPASAPAVPSATVDGAVEETSGVNPSVGRYLRSLLKTKYPESTISKEAIQEVQRLVYQFGLHFLVTVKRHLESARKNTLMIFDMPICLQRVLSSSSLYSEFSASMTAALKRFEASYEATGADASSEAKDSVKDSKDGNGAADEKRKQMWAARAGLSIPPTRIKEFAKQYLSNFRFSQNSITGLTALLEHLATLVFQLAFEKAQELNRKRISQADVQSAVSGYTNLQWLQLTPVVPIV